MTAATVTFLEPHKATVTNIRSKSIQGEQQSKSERVFVPAAPEDVDKYVDDATEGELICRSRGPRHDFPPLSRKAKPVEQFTEVDEFGNPVRRNVCRCCGKAERVEQWGFQRGRLTLISAHVHYPSRLLKPGEKPYTMPSGMGRATSRAIQSSIATLALGGMSEAKFRQQIKKLPKSKDHD